MKYLLPLLISSTLLFSNEELSFEDDLLQGLEEVSEIATKTKLNIDDSPSLVTVLHSNKLQKLGIDTVFEALAQVPGVQLKREASGIPVVVFRGISQKGEVKLLFDGITINNTYRGSIYHFLDFPIEMVERIEVIRGAGSVLYGSGAISGVINVITKNSNPESRDAVFVSGGTYDNYKGGAHLSTKISNVNVAVDAYYQDSQKNIENIDSQKNDYSVGIKINGENLGVIARIKKFKSGNSYGILGVPDREKDKYFNKNGSLYTQIFYKDSLSKNNDIELFAGFSRYGQEVEDIYPISSYPTVHATYYENSYYGEMNLKSKTLSNNELLIGARVETSRVKESVLTILNQKKAPIADPNSKRDTASFYINDQYTVLSSLDISAGIRYDNYSDSGDAFSPTIGAVYRVTKKLRVKALYAKAFRAPSWVELTSNENLQAETSNSIEAGVVYKANQNNNLRFNLYSTKLNDMISKDSLTRKYIQTTSADFLGAEIEYSYFPNNTLEFNIFASFTEAKDADGNDLPDVANTLATTSLIYTTNFGVNFGSLLKYISSSKRTIDDVRDDFDSSLIFDETISYNFKNFTLSLIIKDMFNQGTYYALPTSTLYDDFNDGGRSFLFKASMEF
jgi:iron complex outermembrane receptor protein